MKQISRNILFAGTAALALSLAPSIADAHGGGGHVGGGGGHVGGGHRRAATSPAVTMAMAADMPAATDMDMDTADTAATAAQSK